MSMREKQRKYDAVQHGSSSSRNLRGWRGRDVTEYISHHRHREMKVSVRRDIVPLKHPWTTDQILVLADRLCKEHPAISTYEGIFGGIPHLKGLRLSVADILEQLYLTGSVDAVRNIYSPDVSEDQIKEAIAYAQDLLESAFSS
jgi:uncharacterized protein (DUF433 family)